MTARKLTADPASIRDVTEARPRRGRPPIISNEHLLEIARQVFLEQGIRATTGEVAARAGVSEGVLFHRFKSKDALFREAMRFDPEEIPEPFGHVADLAGKGDLRTTLVELATRLLEVGRVALPVMMMSWSNPAGDLCLSKVGNKPHGYRQAAFNLRDFFAGEIAAGRLRKTAHPEALTRVFMGSLHHYCMTELVFAKQPSSTLTPRAYVEHLVEMLLDGAKP